jgi:mutator protein MutT
MSKELQTPNELKVRVYGIIESKGNVLLSHERYNDFEFTKFPGGGLEFGETPIECLKRELQEELSISVVKFELLHVSEVYVQNRFNPKQQVIGIYYRVDISEEDLKIINSELNLAKLQGSLELVRRYWCPIIELGGVLTFEMDQDCALRLIKKGPE